MRISLALIASILVGALAFGSATPVAADATIAVSLDEFSVAPSPNSATPGVITFNVSNDGAIIHDFHVIQTNLSPGGLPVDQSTAQVDFTQVNVVSSTGTIQGGSSDSTAPNLSAANYVLICNLPGHYEGGMYAAFTVAQAPASTATTAPGQPSATLAPGETAVPDGIDGGTDGTGGGGVDSPVTGYGPDGSGSSNEWLFVLPLTALALAFGALALLRARRTG